MADVNVTLQIICAPSDDVVAREIEGETIIAPLVAGIGEADDELYTLNASGQAIWQKLDGQRTLGGERHAGYAGGVPVPGGPRPGAFHGLA